MIFINYRHSETAGAALLIYDALRDVLPEQAIFIDHKFVGGDLFKDKIEEKVGLSKIMISVIGPFWLVANDKKGRQRIAKKNDFVRAEIRRALATDTRIVPVLVQSAEMPKASELPSDIRELADRLTVTISHQRMKEDCKALALSLKDALRQYDQRHERASLAGLVFKLFRRKKTPELAAVVRAKR